MFFFTRWQHYIILFAKFQIVKRWWHRKLLPVIWFPFLTKTSLIPSWMNIKIRKKKKIWIINSLHKWKHKIIDAYNHIHTFVIFFLPAMKNFPHKKIFTLEDCMGRISPLRPQREIEISARARPGPKQNTKFWPGSGPANFFSDFDPDSLI